MQVWLFTSGLFRLLQAVGPLSKTPETASSPSLRAPLVGLNGRTGLSDFGSVLGKGALASQLGVHRFVATARLRAARSIPSSVPRVLLYHQRPVLYHGTVGVRELSLLAGYWGRLQPPYAIVCPPTPSHHHLGSVSFGTTLEPYSHPFSHVAFPFSTISFFFPY